MATWIVKSEPSEYGWADLARDRRTTWTGIRNFTARNNVRAMRPGERVLFFHTGKEKAVVGLAEVLAGPTDDPTEPGAGWAAVELGPVKPLAVPVPLATLKATPATREISVVKMGRLSVGALTAAEFSAVLKLGKTAR